MGLAGYLENREMLQGKRLETFTLSGQNNNFTDTHSDSFYLSGYEAIFLRKTQHLAIKTVVSSTISFEDDLLVVGSKESLGELEVICKDLSINYFALETSGSEEDALKVELMLSAHKRISNVLYTFNDTENFKSIEKLIQVCQDAKVDFTVNVLSSDIDVIKEGMMAHVSYLVFPNKLSKEKSLIIANRSSLVKTEGVSASFEYDLHSKWQRGLDKRKSGILPMMA
ncbi:hypothetical protein [Plebeiibacterium marinum]|uniref:Uncharacterized protein n=1 Tax=Plebeiibacterium marinum TaxID=2992111 RepID=A0AAE3SK80_9BACT|nr:hypothetical protein [Plebeiobacterium marinum]MCW3805180.1 hypothetical protein [Plebeiobacterium marinum]